MAFRTIIIERAARLHARKEQLVVKQDQDIRVPLDDILVILISSPDVVFSSAFLSKVTGYGICIITCDNRYLPAAMACSFLPHSRQAKMTQKQFKMTKPFQNRLWQALVKSKISNQADSLDYYGIVDADRLRNYAAKVVSGDTNNLEGTAARYYFPRLFDGHLRSDDNVINDALNYAYTIVRSIVARSIVAHGLYPPLGIHHKNEFNAFNLADDLIEPFRPLVDVYVRSHPPLKDQLQVEDRRAYMNLAHLMCLIDGKRMTLASAVRATTSSFVEALNCGDYRRLVLPSIDGIEIKSDAS
ncbi:MAG: type II CRISPR-associated endonuclease Cas1 [Coriobacteriia bacterium]|nr:type II CRISPR-associated endonuclease Cas1 [Coriobacteriia bacterium]